MEACEAVTVSVQIDSLFFILSDATKLYLLNGNTFHDSTHQLGQHYLHISKTTSLPDAMYGKCAAAYGT
jgi:hypothetical protein